MYRIFVLWAQLIDVRVSCLTEDRIITRSGRPFRSKGSRFCISSIQHRHGLICWLSEWIDTYLPAHQAKSSLFLACCCPSISGISVRNCSRGFNRVIHWGDSSRAEGLELLLSLSCRLAFRHGLFLNIRDAVCHWKVDLFQLCTQMVFICAQELLRWEEPDLGLRRSWKWSFNELRLYLLLHALHRFSTPSCSVLNFTIVIELTRFRRFRILERLCHTHKAASL